MWYLVRRGTEPRTLDQALKAQALAGGVEITCGQSIEHLPEGGIVAHGPRRVDAIAVGYVFPTDRSDGAFGVVSDDLAPAGYAYLLICGGRATLASCMFDDFHNDKQYLARTVQFFEKAVGVTPRNARAFGGFGNMSAEPTVRRGKLLLVGEAAGLQDALFGFGMRFALVSGQVAGRAFVDDDLPAYETAYQRRLRPSIRAAAVNRYLYRRTGATGYRRLVERVSSARDPRAWLRQYYSGRWWTALMYPIARAEAQRLQAAATAHECRAGCDCTYCRCMREAASESLVDDTAASGSSDRDVAEPAGSSGIRRRAS
jgi:hypothetical protein